MNNNTVEQISYDFVLALLSIILILLIISLFLSCRNRLTHLENQSETRLENPPPHPPPPSARVYNFTDINTATDGFNPQRIIGRGNTSTIYAAVLSRNDDVVVAVKRIHPTLVLRNASLGFSATIKSTLFSSSSAHPNVVGMLGYCQAPGERVVVMEFIGMVNLDCLLHDSKEGKLLLDWNRRLRIAAGVARGIEYLHEKMGSSGIVHGCVKSSKVLLDGELNPKICDYGMWFLKANNQAGGGGYVDEEYWKSGPSKESDVYGFGVVLLEILTGRRAAGTAELAKWAVPLMKESMFSEILDPRLAVRTSDVNVVVRLCKVASACVSNCRMSRPTIVQVAAILNCLERDSCC